MDEQMPWELEGLPSILTKVSIDGTTSSSLVTVLLAEASPAFWQVDDPDTGQRFADARAEDGSRISAANRAKPGQLISLRANGLGPVENRPPSGEPAPADPLSPTKGAVSVRIGDRDISPEFSGLLAGTVGVYEVRLRLPDDIARGTQTITVTVNGVTSPESKLPVEE
jgi:uncharacterized protein (TIGR03437 family)